MRWLVCSVFSTALTLAPYLHGQDDFFGSISIDVPKENNEKPGIESRGFIKQILKYGFETPDESIGFERDQKGLAKVRTEAFWALRGDISEQLRWKFSAKGEVDWIRWQSGEQEEKLNNGTLRLKDAYIDWTPENNIWVRAGHQLFAWGESEGLAVTDVMSLRDNREPGQAELQDVREQIPAVMVSFPVQSGKAILVTSYNAGHDRMAKRDEEFYPYITLKNSGVRIEERSPKQQWEYALKWETQLNGGDISLVLADVNANELSLSRVDAVVQTPLVVFTQDRISVAGATANKVMGNWLYKGEIARYWGQPVYNNSGLPWQKENQWRGMFGVEYAGITDLQIGFELNSIYMSEEFQNPNQSHDKLQNGCVFRLLYSALNERMNSQFWAIKLTEGDGVVYRADLTYDINDALELSLGSVFYTSSEDSSSLYVYRNNDTVNLGIKLSF